MQKKSELTGKVKATFIDGKYGNPWPEYTRAGFGSLLKFALFDKDRTNLPKDLSVYSQLFTKK
jgi:hypothetical protein